MIIHCKRIPIDFNVKIPRNYWYINSLGLFKCLII